MMFRSNKNLAYDASASNAKIYDFAGKSSASISELIDLLQQPENNVPQSISNGDNIKAIALLESIQLFLDSTSIDFQAARKPFINDDVIKKILESPATALIRFQAIKSNAFLLATLQYCVACLKEQLKKLESTSDPIFVRYLTVSNSLRDIMQPFEDQQENVREGHNSLNSHK